MNKYFVTLLLLLLFNNHLLSQKEKVVTIHQPQNFRLSSKGRTLVGGNATIVLDIALPPNTVKWYYTFGATRDNDRVQQTQNELKLVAQLTKLIDRSGTTANALNLLTGPPGEDFCNVYLFPSQEDANNFDKDLSSYSYNRQGSRPNYRSGIVEITDPIQCRGTQFVGIDNPSGFYGISCAIEVVAIVREEETFNGWTSTRKDEIFNMFKVFAEKVCSNLSDGERFRFASCGTKKITMRYTDVSIKSLGEHEVIELISKSCEECANEYNFECNPNFEKPLSLTKNDLMGRWKDENSTIILSNTGMFFINYDGQEGGSRGEWRLQDNKFTIILNGRIDNYEIIEFKKNSFKYRFIKDGTIFNAIKVE